MQLPAEWEHELTVVPSTVLPGKVKCRTFRGLCSCLSHSDELLTYEEAEAWGDEHWDKEVVQVQ